MDTRTRTRVNVNAASVAVTLSYPPPVRPATYAAVQMYFD